MASGGAGLQHLASCVIKEDTPTTSTPPLPDFSLARGFLICTPSSGPGAGSAGRSSVLDVAQRVLVLADHLEQASATSKPSCRPAPRAGGRAALALQQLLDQLAALGHGLARAAAR
jgi:hypothetical protein